MMYRARRIPILLCALPILCSLAGCGSVNSHLAAGMGDVIPQWAGGLPADAPPRPGTAKYDEMMKEREREPLTPKMGDTATQSTNDNNATGAIH
jgi:pantoate kinase